MGIDLSSRFVLLIQPVPLEEFSSLEPEFRILTLSNLQQTPADLYDILPKAEAVLATGPVDSTLIAKMLSLKVIVINGAGYDAVDVAAATALRIPVYNIPDITSRPTAELALTLMLSVCRRVSELDRALRLHENNLSDYFRTGANPGHTLEGKTLGIVGLGHIGMELAKMCWAMKMNILYTCRHRLPIQQERSLRFVSMDELLAKSDIVSIHTPLTEETFHLINESAFMKMKPGSILINTSRGDTIDQDALVRFLQGGKLAGAGLDVFPNETNIHPALFHMNQVVLTPHIGTNTIETRQAMAHEMTSIVRAVCDQSICKYGHLVNPEIYHDRKEKTNHEENGDQNDLIDSDAPDTDNCR